jgi:hypothetical protein
MITGLIVGLIAGAAAGVVVGLLIRANQVTAARTAEARLSDVVTQNQGPNSVVCAPSWPSNCGTPRGCRRTWPD